MQHDIFDQELLARGRVAIGMTDGVATVTLSAPEIHNAQLPETWQALKHIGSRIVEVGAEGSTGSNGVRIVIVRGAGPSFSAGLDRSAFSPEPDALLATIARQPAGMADQTIADFQAGFSWLADPTFISIAAVQGHAIGAGFQLALACDLIVAGDDAQFTMAEVTLGLVPDLGGSGRLIDRVGVARALEICATGRRVAADEAARIGLVQSVVPAADLDDAVTQWSTALTACDAAAVRAVTRLITGAAGRSADEQRSAERAEQITRLRALASAIEQTNSPG